MKLERIADKLGRITDIAMSVMVTCIAISTVLLMLSGFVFGIAWMVDYFSHGG